VYTRSFTSTNYNPGVSRLGFRIEGSNSSSIGFYDNFVVNLLAAPVEADAGGPYTVDEGSIVTLTAAANASASFAWDLDNDGQFDDATGPSTGFSGVDGLSVHNVAVQATFAKNLFWDFENATNAGSISTSVGTPTGSGITGIASQTGGGPAETFGGGNGKVHLTRFLGPVNYPYIDFTTAQPITLNSITFSHIHNHNPGFPTQFGYQVQLQINSGSGWSNIGSPLAINAGNSGATSTIDLGSTLVNHGKYKIRWLASGYSFGNNSGTEFFSINDLTLAASVQDDSATTVTVNNVAPVVDKGVVDLSAWTPENISSGSGVWDVEAGGNSVIQKVNGNPTFFYSDFNALGSPLQGSVQVQGTNDDDFIGFAIGFAPGDTSNSNADYLLVDWKQGNQTAFGGFAPRGLAVSRVTGVGSNLEFWSHIGDVTELARANTLGSTGWADFQTYEFQFEFSANRLKVFVNCNLELDVTPSGPLFSDGRFGFYNFSQDPVRYSAVQSDSISGDEASQVSFSKDFEDFGVIDIHTATIDWGDSPTGPGTITVNDTFGSSLGSVDGTHTYADNGTYTVFVEVCDGDGGCDSDTFTASIANVDPTVDGGGPYSVDEGSPVNLSATGFDVAGAADPLTYAWDLDNNGSFETPGQNVPFSGVDGPSTHVVQVRVSDGDGGTAIDGANFIPYVVPTGTVGNQNYNGSLGLDFDVVTPITISQLGVFDSGSNGLSVPITARLYNRATQGQVTSLVFPVGDTGTLIDGSRFLPLPSPITLPAGFRGTIVAENYQAGEPNGNWAAGWTTDNGGGSVAFVGGARFGSKGAFPASVDTGPANRYAASTFMVGGILITVNNVAPTATFIVGGPVDEGTSFDLSLTNPEDPSSEDTSAGFTYAFDCGSGLSAFSSASSTSCPTDDDGTPSVSGVIRDKDGGQTTYNGQATVNNVAPTLTISGAASVNEGTEYSLGLSSSDPGDDTITKWTIDWGDGGTPEDVTGDPASALHTYADGTIDRNITATATDEDGTFSSNSISVTVNNVAPTLGAIPATAENFSGQIHGITATFTDPGVDDTHTATIDWDEGDGHESVTVTQGSGSGSLSGSHQYLETGVYNIVVTVMDDNGGSDSADQEKTVIRLTVTIDIKPGGEPNSINLGSKGVIPVGVLSGTYDGVVFDATTIVGSLLVFEGTGIAHGDSHVEDLDGTAPDDSVSHYRTQETVLAEDSVEGCLTGETSGGIMFTGCDSVRIVPPDNSNGGGSNDSAPSSAGGDGKGKGKNK
jgi:hypothetical protein